MAKEKKITKGIEIINRKAKYQYNFISTFEAGIVLQGTEIKSIRAGYVNLNDAYCYFKGDELIIRSLYIKEYEFGTYANHEPRRPRKLLLRRQELKKLQRKVKEKGYSIIPYRLYISERGFAKLEIVLVSGKKSHDKRESIRQKDAKRDLDRMKKYR